MKQTKEYCKQAMEEISDIPSGQLPTIDLYMDQVITLLNRRENCERNAVTKTMINNYRKQDIIKPLQGKKYTPEHLIQLLLVLQLKNALSIGEIEQILPTLYSLPQGDYHLKEAYDRFLNTVPKINLATEDLCDLLLPKEQDGFDTLYTLLIISRLQQYLQNMASDLVAEIFLEDNN